MSRSIHTTWRKLIKERKRQQAGEVSVNIEKIDKMHDELIKKHEIKSQILKQRKKEKIVISTNTESLPIYINDDNEFFHYPMTEKDIRALIDLLPKGMIDALKCIVLKSGIEAQFDLDDAPEPDPFTGRPGYELLPCVYIPKILGCYFNEKSQIEIYAYVYKNIVDFKFWNIYLKLTMFKTLIHEISHHFDRFNRIDRGRWIRRDKDKIEIYAEEIEHKLLHEIAVPYIETTYQEEFNALNEWILLKAGIHIPIHILAGDPRKNCKGEYVNVNNIIFPTDESFCEFVKSVYANKDLMVARIELARDLHYAEYYDLSLEILETALNADKNDESALKLKADIFAHKGCYSEAEIIISEALKSKKDDYEIWMILCNIYLNQKNWHKLLNSSNMAIELAPDIWDSESAIIYHIKALVETGDVEEANLRLDELSKSKRISTIKQVQKLKEGIN